MKIYIKQINKTNDRKNYITLVEKDNRKSVRYYSIHENDQLEYVMRKSLHDELRNGIRKKDHVEFIAMNDKDSWEMGGVLKWDIPIPETTRPQEYGCSYIGVYERFTTDTGISLSARKASPRKDLANMFSVYKGIKQFKDRQDQIININVPTKSR